VAPITATAADVAPTTATAADVGSVGTAAAADVDVDVGVGVGVDARYLQVPASVGALQAVSVGPDHQLAVVGGPRKDATIIIGGVGGSGPVVELGDAKDSRLRGDQ
jgi:hypothetical protein